MRLHINEIGGGIFYDDDRVIDDIIRKIKFKLRELNLSKVEAGLPKIKKKLNPKERVIEYRLKKKIEENKGNDFLNQVFKNLNQ